MLTHLCWQPPLWTWHSSISAGSERERQKQAEGKRWEGNECNLAKSSHYEKKKKLVTRIKPRRAAKLREEFNAGFRIKMYSKNKGDDG